MLATAAMMMGSATGRNSTGSSSSRARVCTAIAEVIVLGFFVILAWTGWQMVQVLEGDRLVSLTWVPVQLTQSVIPIGGVLFVLCELLSLPEYLRITAAGMSLEHAEIEEEVETELQKAQGR